MVKVTFRRVIDELEMFCGTIRIDLLDHEICDTGVQLKSGSGRNRARAYMRLDPHIIGFRHSSDLLRLHDAAGIPDVRLKNVGCMRFNYWTEAIASVNPLTQCHRNGDVLGKFL